MSKVAVSPNEYFTGTVSISEPLNLPQVLGLERAIVAAQELVSPIPAEFNLALLPGILPCIESWELAHMPKTVTLETFPGSPRDASRELVAWLANQVRIVYLGEADVPNA